MQIHAVCFAIKDVERPDIEILYNFCFFLQIVQSSAIEMYIQTKIQKIHVLLFRVFMLSQYRQNKSLMKVLLLEIRLQMGPLSLLFVFDVTVSRF